MYCARSLLCGGFTMSGWTAGTSKMLYWHFAKPVVIRVSHECLIRPYIQPFDPGSQGWRVVQGWIDNSTVDPPRYRANSQK